MPQLHQPQSRRCPTLVSPTLCLTSSKSSLITCFICLASMLSSACSVRCHCQCAPVLVWVCTVWPISPTPGRQWGDIFVERVRVGGASVSVISAWYAMYPFNWPVQRRNLEIIWKVNPYFVITTWIRACSGNSRSACLFEKFLFLRNTRKFLNQVLHTLTADSTLWIFKTLLKAKFKLCPKQVSQTQVKSKMVIFIFSALSVVIPHRPFFLLEFS